MRGKTSSDADTNTVMALTTTIRANRSAVLGPRRAGAPLADLTALVCAVSAGVHGALVGPHLEESEAMAAAFVVCTVALAVAAVGEALAPTPWVSVTTATVLAGTAAAYLLARTTGIPVLSTHPEPFDALGLVTSALEVVGAVLAVLHLNPRRIR
ncbi:hypothetical protein Noca_4641 [Nocardioides sp. JS614]|nr:hypothetical protein Noca_4641 [Nocardioides sp. JS614]